MYFRIFSKKHNLYTNSPLWPSNQRSFSDWAIAPNGEIVELIYFGAQTEEASIEIHNARDFIVEPWSGYFDTKGKKIYRGDILGSFKADGEVSSSYEVEVVWHEGGFYCKDEQSVPDSWMPLDIENRAWKRHFIKGNIHGVEYDD